MKNFILFIFVLISGIVIGWSVKAYNDNSLQGKSDSQYVRVKKNLEDIRLIDSLVNYGDTLLYNKLRRQYDNEMYNFLGIAMIMANKYNYTNAYEDVFESFHEILKSGHYYDTRFNYSKYDEKTKKIALEYLEVAAKRNNLSALEMKCMYDENCNYEKLVDSIRY